MMRQLVLHDTLHLRAMYMERERGREGEERWKEQSAYHASLYARGCGAGDRPGTNVN